LQRFPYLAHPYKINERLCQEEKEEEKIFMISTSLIGYQKLCFAQSSQFCPRYFINEKHLRYFQALRNHSKITYDCIQMVRLLLETISQTTFTKR